MSTIDLSGDIAVAINGAYDRGNPVVVGYTDDRGRASLSVRGSTQVHGKTQLAVWARSTTTGLAKAIEERPYVSLLFFGSNDAGPRMFLSIKGKAQVDPSQNDKVYNAMIPGEREHDPEKNGVAIIIEVGEINGFSPETGPISQSRDAA
ncbi:pyridoxamine 5'-phosphate oxidase family protein [Amycolatopsis pithecellobii]|uniref:Pyridoxamine 5'-phosphate oxidase putative domain-containing protein n=1 Tax=Amycolatopsis pithecellobii TaxID=664692 RepID=A0A6N7Z350_9PSEU|nr:pyridoxamine 5'-phosphate oxidase family protein [Amycolatopsis pithecellobii]MTD55479.1 hypothetical protein [Amycolatopsis pithecellobii]